MTEQTEQERRELETKALNAGFHLAMTVRSYLGTLDPHDEMLRRWVLNQLEEQLPRLAADVITSITRIEDIDYFQEHGFPR